MQVENARVRIVLAEGERSRHGLLRFVLEGDGFSVVAVASSGAELVRATEAEQPDCVVVDEAIGAGAIAMARAAAPGTPIVMVSQSPTTVSVDGWVRLTDVLRSLGATVSGLSATEPLAASGSSTATPTYSRPEWVDRIRKDPATLREILATKARADVRPSVTELQRRTVQTRMHPSVAWRRDAAPRTQAEAPTIRTPPATSAPVGTRPARVVVVPDLPATQDDAPREDHRRLGAFAMGAAAVAGALVFGLTFGRGTPVVWTAAGTEAIPTSARADGPARPSADHRSSDSRHGAGGSKTSGTTTPVGTENRAGGDPNAVNDPNPKGPPSQPPGNSGEHNPHGGPPGQDRSERPNHERAVAHASVRAHPHKR